MSNYPPVFVMNLYYTGIGIARSLYEFGIPVYGLSSNRGGPGKKSRFFRRVYQVPDSGYSSEALCRQLILIRKSFPEAPVIFPTRDFDALFLEQNRERLVPFYRLPQPEGCAVSQLLDKLEVAKTAERLQIDVPKTVCCRSLREVLDELELMTFPVILKPRFSYKWRGLANWSRVGGKKVILVSSAEELLDEYQRVSTVSEEVILQDYIPGIDTDCVSFGCYMRRNGDLAGYFTTRKVIQSPPLLGTGCVVETVNIPEIVSPSVALLRAFGYVGLAEVEFKYNKYNGTFSLIEINPRHWDQHELGRLLGVNLTLMALTDMTSEPTRSPTASYKGLTRYKWIAERELLLSLLKDTYVTISSITRARKKSSLGDILKCISTVRGKLVEAAVILRGRRIFGVFCPIDPLPFLLVSVQLAGELLRVALGRAQRRFS